jgi:hypothetical protein
MPLPTLKPQEISFDDSRSDCRFQPSDKKPFLATPAALKAYGDVIFPCLSLLQPIALVPPADIPSLSPSIATPPFSRA